MRGAPKVYYGVVSESEHRSGGRGKAYEIHIAVSTVTQICGSEIGDSPSTACR